MAEPMLQLYEMVTASAVQYSLKSHVFMLLCLPSWQTLNYPANFGSIEVKTPLTSEKSQALAHTGTIEDLLK